MPWAEASRKRQCGRHYVLTRRPAPLACVTTSAPPHVDCNSFTPPITPTCCQLALRSLPQSLAWPPGWRSASSSTAVPDANKVNGRTVACVALRRTAMPMRVCEPRTTRPQHHLAPSVPPCCGQRRRLPPMISEPPLLCAACSCVDGARAECRPVGHTVWQSGGLPAAALEAVLGPQAGGGLLRLSGRTRQKPRRWWGPSEPRSALNSGDACRDRCHEHKPIAPNVVLR